MFSKMSEEQRLLELVGRVIFLIDENAVLGERWALKPMKSRWLSGWWAERSTRGWEPEGEAGKRVSQIDPSTVIISGVHSKLVGKEVFAAELSLSAVFSRFIVDLAADVYRVACSVRGAGDVPSSPDLCFRREVVGPGQSTGSVSVCILRRQGWAALSPLSRQPSRLRLGSLGRSPPCCSPFL